MSWNFDFIAESKPAAVAEIQRQAAQENGIPQSVADLIIASVGDLPGDVAIKVNSNGHIGGDYGHSCNFEVGRCPLIRTPAEEPAPAA